MTLNLVIATLFLIVGIIITNNLVHKHRHKHEKMEHIHIYSHDHHHSHIHYNNEILDNKIDEDRIKKHIYKHIYLDIKF